MRETIGRLWFYSKDEATNFNSDIANDNNFKSFEYKGKLLENTVPQDTPNQANGIKKNATIAMPSKYLKDHFVWIDIKQKVKKKIQQMIIDIF